MALYYYLWLTLSESVNQALFMQLQSFVCDTKLGYAKCMHYMYLMQCYVYYVPVLSIF